MVQSGPFKNSLVALSTLTLAEADDDDEDDEEKDDGIIIFLLSLTIFLKLQ